MRILLADDSADDALLFCETLHASHPLDEVAHATTSTGALEHVRQQKFDLVVLDYYLPVMCATELLGELRAAGYRGPVAVLSSQLPPAEKELLDTAGASFSGEKPGDLDEFAEIVARLRRLVCDR